MPCVVKAAAADRQTACSCQAWFTSMYACAALVCPACLRQRLLTAEQRQPHVLLAHCHVRLRCIGGPGHGQCTTLSQWSLHAVASA